MLEDIEELRLAMGTDDMAADLENTSPLGAVDVLFGSRVTPSFHQILSQFLPTRQEADRLIAAYFRAKTVAAPFIHTSQFRRQYQNFWNDPSRAPPLWTSMMFTICYITTSTLMPRNDEDVDAKYSTAAAHCLVIGGFSRPKRFAVEALLLFAQSRVFTRLDIPPEVATLMSLVIRLASKLGYHREPERFSMSTFEKEMRRRTWSLCIQLDLLTCFQIGLPSTVQYPTWDTKPPSNLLDSDFDEDTMTLPAPRPDTELTDIVFYNAKHRLVVVFEKVLRNTLNTNEDADLQVDELDNEVRKTYAAIPEILHPRPMSESTVDPPYLTVTRLCVAFMFQKCRCVLHRRYVAQNRLVSIRTCYEASMQLVRLFTDAYAEFQPGGQNESERWFFSSITWHDFLLGATSLCLIVCVLSQNNFGIDIDGPRTLELLRKCQQACVEQSSNNADTRRAAKVVRATVALFEAQIDQAQSEASLFAKQDTAYAVPSEQIGFGNVTHSSTLRTSMPGDADMPGVFDWGWDDDLSRPIEDPSWSYLEQFLNLQPDESMNDL